MASSLERGTERPAAAAAVEAEVEATRETDAHANYLRVRDLVLSMKDAEAAKEPALQGPSDYWREELENFDYMLDASPLIIAKLRRHCFHLTGVRAHEYRSNREKERMDCEAKLEALIELGGEELLVPESPLLGGFGFEIGGALYNLDTLKFYESLIALERAALLAEFRRGPERRVVWEIGGGWGGFAYQFKTLFPDTTYVISDLPEVLLFSATYLMTVFPEAECRFWTGEQAPSGWEAADFVFVPAARLQALELDRLDLTVNMVSFQEMTTEQVDAYVRRAFELGCPYLYSHNCARSPYNAQLSSVPEVIGRWYWPHEIPVLGVSYTRMRLPDRRKRLAGPDPDGYRHIAGWRRMLP